MRGENLPALMSSVNEITSMPGGREMLMSAVVEKAGGQGGKKLRLYAMGGRARYEGGGLAEAASLVQEGGRGDDEVLLHISPERI